MAAEKMEDYFPHFVYSIALALDQEKSGFFVKNEGISFPYLGQWAEEDLPCFTISLPKGIQVHAEDEKGAYYTYEDIRDHQPLTYVFHSEIASEIRKMTKLLRFSVQASDMLHTQKPSVRISKNEATDMKKSWIFNKYKLVMDSK
ncbi:hypothetical protein [Paenibacillus sp. QZ-Y1]|uniref:hypothetical protein n=1 Tax=Paenibacillus sp. QZ-Y1 TaxID=3414511 RepID=UPI003F7B0BB6